jgi:cell division protein FtsA
MIPLKGLRQKLGRPRKSEARDHYTALDIGTEWIKALVVKRDSFNGIVVGASRRRQAFTDMQAGAVADIQAVIDNCDEALTQAEDMCSAVPGQAVIGLAGEQVKGFSTSVTIPRNDPTLKINEVELSTMLQMVQKRALREATHLMSQELSVPDVSVRLINSAITTVRIDGYAVNNPVNFQGKQMEVTVFNTFAPLTHVGALQTIASELDLELLATVAEPYAMARCCASDEVYEFGGVFIDIGGGTTDVALVRNGGIEGTRMFPIGGRVFTKKIAAQLGISFNEAEQLKLEHSRGQLPGEQRSRVHGLVGQDAEVLTEAVALTLQDLAKGDRLPTAIYLAGGGAALPEVVEQLRAYPWTMRLPFSKTPSITLLKPQDVKNIYDSTGLLLDQQDITPMGLAYHAIQLEEDAEDVLYNVMRKVLKAMHV